MKKAIDAYIEASGANETTRNRFDKLERSVPKLPTNPFQAAIAVKRWLGERGFSYDADTFRAQDVLGQSKGNCLGLPLIMGAILDARGIPFQYQALVNPQDAISDMERREVERYNAETRYDRPVLAERTADSPMLRCTPLEHLTLDLNGVLFETTSDSHEIRGGESARRIGFNQATSYVLKDRAVEEGLEGNIDEAEKLAKSGLKIWPGNREIYVLQAKLAHQRGDIIAPAQAFGRYTEFDGDDSLFLFNRFTASGDPSYLDAAIAKYSACAQAINAKARTLTESDPREAKFLFGLASHLYANSSVLSLQDFYTDNTESLTQLFGKEVVNAQLRGFLAAPTGV